MWLLSLPVVDNKLKITPKQIDIDRQILHIHRLTYAHIYASKINVLYECILGRVISIC